MIPSPTVECVEQRSESVECTTLHPAGDKCPDVPEQSNQRTKPLSRRQQKKDALTSQQLLSVIEGLRRKELTLADCVRQFGKTKQSFSKIAKDEAKIGRAHV